MEQLNGVNIPEEYRPISAWGFVGWSLLFNLPLAGIILVIVFACGASPRKNLTNYARSYLLMMLLVFIITFVITLFALLTGVLGAIIASN